MTAVSKTRMSVEEYLAWSENEPGRYELVDGRVFAQAAERAAHARMKLDVAVALRSAISNKGLPCHVLPDGMAVRINDATVYEPDTLVYCGPQVAPETLLIEKPLIVVEVLSPSTGRNDLSRKLAGYFRLLSVRHYLIVDPDEPLVIHHERREDGTIVSHILREGTLRLDPPGIELAVAQLYEAA